MKKQVSIFLLILVLFSVIGFSFHRHEDGFLHDDCPECVTASHCQYVTSDGNPDIQRNEAVVEVISASFPSESLEQFASNLTVRAPPVLL